jgi:type III secretion protein N (ATPase)
MLAKYDEVEILLRIGEFQKGSDPLADLAVDRRDAIDQFLRQPGATHASFEHAVETLHALTAQQETS